ncbi:MAG: hypothetical protein AB8F78_18150 [Saprospiraceae bacterium]
MRTKRQFKLYLALALLTIASSTFGQTISEKANILQQYCKEYGTWLHNTGIGEYIQYREMAFEEGHLTVYLEFTSTEIDSVLASWEGVKASFENQSPFSLEETLFSKAVFITELDRRQITIALFDTYDTNKRAVFERGISYTNVSLSIHEVNPMSPTPIEIVAPIRATPTIKSPINKAQVSGKALMECLKDSLVAEHVGYRKIKNKKDSTIIKESELTENRLDITFHNMRGLIINESFLQKITNVFIDYEIAKLRESISFSLIQNYTKSGDAMLFGNINGKVGSSFYDNIDPDSYIDIEYDYKDDWNVHVRGLELRLLKMLEGCQNNDD